MWRFLQQKFRLYLNASLFQIGVKIYVEIIYLNAFAYYNISGQNDQIPSYSLRWKALLDIFFIYTKSNKAFF